MKRLSDAFGAIFASEGTFTGRTSAFRHIKNFSIVVATSLTLIACGGGGGGGGGASLTPDTPKERTDNVVNPISQSPDLTSQSNEAEVKTRIEVEEIMRVAGEVTASETMRDSVMRADQVIGSINQGTGGIQARLQKNADGNVLLKAGYGFIGGLLFGFSEPVLELVDASGGVQAQIANLDEPSTTYASYDYTLCTDGVCSSNITTTTSPDSYYATGYWKHGNNFGVFADGSAQLTIPNDDRTAEFIGTSTGCYWDESSNEPIGIYLGAAAFTASFSAAPTIGGNVSVVSAYDNGGFNAALTGIVFDFQEESIEKDSDIYAVKGGGVSCANGRCTGGAGSWGGMLISITADDNPDVFAGTYGFSDVDVASERYDFVGVFSSPRVGIQELDDFAGSIASNPTPIFPLIEEQVAVVQYGNNAASNRNLDITVTRSGNGTGFAINRGIDGTDYLRSLSTINDSTLVLDDRLDDSIHNSETPIYRADIRAPRDMPQVYVGIDTTRADNSDDDYWTGGFWYRILPGGAINLNNYELGSFAYYHRLTTAAPSSSNTVTYQGLAFGTGLSSLGLISYGYWETNLSADFSADTIEGELSELQRVGQVIEGSLPERIALNVASVDSDGSFQGTTDADGYSIGGNWGGQFYGDATAGTWGVRNAGQKIIGWFQAEEDATTIPTTPPTPPVTPPTPPTPPVTPPITPPTGIAPVPTDSKTVVAQYNKGAASKHSLSVALSRNGDNTGFALTGGIAGTQLNDVSIAEEQGFSRPFLGENVYVQLGYNDADTVEYSIFTSRESNTDTDYWAGGIWYEYNLSPSGGTLEQNDYEIGSFAYYNRLPTAAPSSGSAVFRGRAFGQVIDAQPSAIFNDHENLISWKAELNADFSANTIKGAMSGGLGRIGYSVPNNITLSAANIDGSGFFSGSTGASGYTNGNWGGQLYGDATAGSWGLSSASQNIVGWFQAEQDAAVAISADEKIVSQFTNGALSYSPGLRAGERSSLVSESEGRPTGIILGIGIFNDERSNSLLSLVLRVDGTGFSGNTVGITHKDIIVSSDNTDYLEGAAWFVSVPGMPLAQWNLGAFAGAGSFSQLTALPSSGEAKFNGNAEVLAVGSTTSAIAAYSAALTANFDSNSVSGRVTGSGAGLPSAINLNTAEIDRPSGFFSGATSASGYDSGEWGGRFSGDAASQAAGTFGLDKTDGSQRIIGYFGTNKQ